MGRRDDVIKKVLARVIFSTARTPKHVVGACWEWQGPTSGDGRGGLYPRMCLNGQTVAVHRVTYTHEYGYIPGRKQIDHKCRNRQCVNPKHLEMVTHRENQRRRAAAAGRQNEQGK